MRIIPVASPQIKSPRYRMKYSMYRTGVISSGKFLFLKKSKTNLFRRKEVARRYWMDNRLMLFQTLIFAFEPLQAFPKNAEFVHYSFEHFKEFAKKYGTDILKRIFRPSKVFRFLIISCPPSISKIKISHSSDFSRDLLTYKTLLN